MTALSEIATAPKAPDQLASTEPAGALLARVFALLEQEEVPFCVLHGYENLPQHVQSDVDCLIARDMLPRRLAQLISSNETKISARLVQWFQDRAHFVVLELRPAKGGAPVMLQLHLSRDYEVDDCVIFNGEDVLRSRRDYRGAFPIPAVAVEFAAVLANRVSKRSLEDRHMRQLSALWAKDPSGCEKELPRLFGFSSAASIAAAAKGGDWSLVQASLPEMRNEMLRRLKAGQPLSVVGQWINRQFHRARRYLSPHSGMHLVFLGPDGVGKSTVIDTVRERLAPAFLSSDYQTFARSLLPNKPKASPHALPPRSFAASLVKAAWWLVCYTLGYYKSVYPKLAAGGLAINHRYFVDAIVDPKRYRYAGPMPLLRWIWAVCPKPDLVIFLDAPADIVWKRKKETSAEETARQCEAYRALAKTLPNARIVNTNQSLEQTVTDVTEIVLGHMNRRTLRRLKVK